MAEEDKDKKTDDSQLNDDNLDNDQDRGQNLDKDKDKDINPDEKYKGWVSPEEFERTQKALKQANDEAKERRLKLKEYEELGLDDLEKAQEILKEREEAELRRAEEEKNFTEWQEKTREKYEREIEKYNEKFEKTNQTAEKYKTQLENYLVDNEALRVLKELDGVPEFILPHLKNEVKVVEDDSGNMTTQVVDKYGDPKMKDGKPMSIKDRLYEMREDDIFGRAFAAPKRSGSGSGTEGDGGGKSAPTKGYYRNEMSNDDKARYVEKHGLDAFRELPRSRTSDKK